MTTAVVLIAMASIWIVGLGYVFGEVRPRSWGAVALTWGGLTAVTTAVSFSLRNTKMAAIFSGIGLAFCAAYGFLRI